MNPARLTRPAAVTVGVSAGNIASRNGSDSAAPALFSNVRRDNAFFEMNMSVSSMANNGRIGVRRDLDSLLKRCAPHNILHDCRELVVLAPAVGHDGAHGGRILIVNASPEGIHQQFLGERHDEIVRPPENYSPE